MNVNPITDAHKALAYKQKLLDYIRAGLLSDVALYRESMTELILLRNIFKTTETIVKGEIMKREEKVLIENLGKLDNIIESMESLYPRDVVTDDSQIDVMIENLYKARLPIVRRIMRYSDGKKQKS